MNAPYSGWLKIEDMHFLIISKNACTTLKAIASNKEGKDFETIHKCRGIPYDSTLDTKLKKVVIYRDPLERFLSIYNNRKVHKIRKFYHIDDIDKFIDFAEEQQDKNIRNTCWMGGPDEHFIPQHKWYNLDDIDIVINIKDLNEFLDRYCNIKREVCENKSQERLKSSDLSNEQISRIKKIYQKDYELYDKIIKSKKLYEPHI